MPRRPFAFRNSGGADWTSLLTIGMLAFALVLGGGGSPAPFQELVVECVAAGVAALWVFTSSAAVSIRRIPQTAWLIAIVVVGIPLLQLIPLPPALWQALPGREIAREALGLIGQDATWRAWSLAPNRTLSALLSLGPPLLLLLLTAALEQRARLQLTATVALVGLISIVLGALQLSADESSALRFYGVTTPQLTAFQANHNSTADLLLIALVAASVALRAAIVQKKLPSNRAVVLAIAGGTNVVFGLGIVLTASRMGIFLLPVALLASMWILRPWLSVSRRFLTGSAVALAGLLVLGLLLARYNPALHAVAARFDFSEELRPQLWQDGFFVARQHFPFGVGMGNFMPAMIADERLVAVRPFLPNRAHNDFIELAAEAGMFGLAGLAAIAWLLGRATWSAFKRLDRGALGTTIFASSALLILALHSVVDYPLRSMSLACLAALCAGLLMAPKAGTDDTTLAGDTR